ncbi:aminomethyl transferase family protein [Mesorhizobium sp. M7A.F.Ca.US.006.01.1.1]|uniref:aminomethyltransferase family protein n=1 Tax=Mesorhizobium sp. M7A.F.Ca.US.006.01.1.1 TaxID=2496707 RepID=UPI000FCB02EE|nr:aminomethyltransferase family protein [Mesorhizobium sp. M7A.F.Ca.US.006.01.1.1]RUZ73360.1 aminomethyl transferase family protein [Mesorhizobium sp. M7A.F.Ca.US.006.01.1.1]
MKNLQEVIDSKHNLVDYFYNDSIAQYHKSRTGLFARFIPPEQSNWREEQRAWRETAALFDQSHHMPVLYVKGPDARKMLSYLTPCSFSNLSATRGKQFIACSPSGNHIGDCMLYYYDEDESFELISGMFVLNWVRFHGETGGYDVEMKFDATSPYNPEGRRTKYRFQVEGPNARAILEQACDGEWPELKFFHRTYVSIAGCKVQVLRHGMAGHAGAEISGPFEEMDRVRNAILEAGKGHGLVPAGTSSYFSASLEDGWMPNPCPAIYTGEQLRTYREWLPADGWEANLQFGGSLYSNNIEDYYSTPWSLGYGHLVKFDHDFIGRAALEQSQNGKRRVKRSLLWDKDDVIKVYASQLTEGPLYKSIEMPIAYFGFPQADEVRSEDGRLVGMSQICGYNNVNDRSVISLVSIDEDFAEPGTQVILTWGEPNGGSRKPHVERHEQTTIRATVSPAPFSKVTRDKLKAAI